MRTPILFAAACVAAVAAVQPAEAGLIGANVSYDFLFPNSTTVAKSIPEQTITPATAIVDNVGGLTTTFTDDQITITNDVLAGFNANQPFDGPEFLFSGVDLGSVTIDPTSSVV